MATSRDVRDIMQLGPAPSAAGPSMSMQPPPAKRSGPPGPPQPRMAGIARELYALIGDNAPTLALAQPVKPKFKERIRRDKPTAQWRFVGFSNPSRGAGMPDKADEDDENRARKKLVLKHWVKDLPPNFVEGAPDHKFAKFNTSSQPFEYTDDEYAMWLKADDWSKAETDHLFELAHRYDLRFIVMADRWELSSERGVDALKNRYYSICRMLAANRPGPKPADEAEKEKLDKARVDSVQQFHFDMNRELERKAYLRSLLERTPAQIAEEDFLYVESRRIEQNYHKIAAERAELLHLLAGREGVGVPAGAGMQVGVGGGAKGVAGGMVGGVPGLPVKKQKGPGWEVGGPGIGLPDGWAGEGSKRKQTAAEDAAMCIERHPAPSVSAPKSNMWPSMTIRSSRLAPVKSSLAQKVAAALAELGQTTSLVMPTKANLARLDELQASLGQMVELKKAVDRVQGEIRLVRKKKAMLLGEEEPVIKGEDDDGPGGSAANRNKRSASVASSTVSNKRARRD
ncbi:hypothetical protein JCM8097_000745 [Rhodosporidiobolus ruineniae]